MRKSQMSPIIIALVCCTLAIAGPATHPAIEYPAAASLAGEVPAAVAVDGHGSTYVAGSTVMPQPELSAPSAARIGHRGQTVYVAKIDSSGHRGYTAYLGGSGAIQVKGIAIDASGNVYIAGYTDSPDLPVIGGVQPARAGGSDAFVAKLDAKGQTWLYSTYLGGSGDDVAEAVAVDRDGNAWLTGRTGSSDFPLQNALQSSKAGDTDAFVAKLSADGSALAYATYAGGGSRTVGHAIAVDPSGAAYIAGAITAGSRPGGLIPGPRSGQEGFVFKLNPDGSELIYAALVDESATSIAVDAGGAAFIAGWSATSGGARNISVTKLEADGSRVFSTNVGETRGAATPAIAVDLAGNAYVTGVAGTDPASDSLLIKLSADGASLLASSPVAGAAALAVTDHGAATLVGTRRAGQPYIAKVSTCAFRLSDALKQIGAAGDSGTISIDTTPECAWSAGASASWVQVTPSGAGSGRLEYRVAPNPGAPRGASVAVGGQTLLVMQAGSTAAPQVAGGFSGPIRTNPGFLTANIPANDDGSTSSKIDLGFSISFFGNPYTNVWVNNNGNITFDYSLSTYSPNPIPQISNVMIAPFWADVDTRGTGSGLTTYGTDTVNGHHAFGVNWISVGYFSSGVDKLNSFQLVLIDRSDVAAGYFDIEMNYSSVQWETGGASGGSGGLGGRSARVGFTNGSGTVGTYFELPGSGVNGAFLDGGPNSLIANSVNSGIPGRYIYGVRAGAIVCATGIDKTAVGVTNSATPLTVNVTASNSTCTWNVTGLPSWITVSSPAGGNGTGTAAVTLQVAANSGSARNATIQIASQNYSVTQGPSDMTITKTHVAGFQPGDTGKVYTITATNSGGTPTSGTVTVTDTLPTGLTATAISGTGWTCTLATLTCTRSDALVALASYPAIVLTFNVASNAASVTNVATVSGGGEVNTSNDTARDFTGIGPQDLAIGIVANGGFQQGDTGDTFTTIVGNSGGASTSGAVTVTFQVPTGLTATAITGPGWTCTLSTKNCTRSDALAAAASYPAITLTVNVASNAPASVTTVATVSGGGETNTTNDTASAVTPIGLPDLTIAKTHSGNFHPGDTGDTYTITVTNSGAVATSGTVTVTDQLPNGLTATAISGTGWSCTLGTLTCTRSDALSGGAAYPAITLTVNVAANAPSSVTNTVTVSGGGETNTGNDSASDVTTISSGNAADLTITKTHAGTFRLGDAGDTYTITVTNSGNASTSGAVTVTDHLPTGLTATAISGTGWSCTLGTLTCTRSDALSGGAAYPAITLTVSVAANAPASVTNNATVSGGGESNTGNDSANDFTLIGGGSGPSDLAITKTHSGTFHQGDVGATYTITVTNAGGSASAGAVSVTDLLPAGLTATAISGNGWTCLLSTLTCTRSDSLAAGTNYPAITLTVNVSANAPPGLINIATVSGGGDANTTNNMASDPTAIGVNSFILSPPAATFSLNGGPGTISIIPPTPTSPWTVVNNNPTWITITSATNGTGPGIVTYTLPLYNGPPRTGTITIGQQTYTIVQTAALSYLISTVAGGAPLPTSVLGTSTSIEPDGMATDSSGNLYFASWSQNAVFKMDSTGTLTRVAGNGTNGYSGDNGPATSAQLNEPEAVAVDAAGNLYIADTYNECIRKVDTAGTITTVAGTGDYGFSGDNGLAINATFRHPNGVAVNSTGTLYVADRDNQRVRKIAGGTITTAAGNGTAGYSGDNAAATSAQLNNPSGVAVDSAGLLYIADTENSRVRKVAANGIITTVAGSSFSGYGGDNGPATAARLTSPKGVAFDSSGAMYIGDHLNYRIRKVVNGTITTLAGTGTQGYSGDGGPAANAQLLGPQGVAADAFGNVYLGDSDQRIRKVSASGVITTAVGGGIGEGGLAVFAGLNYPSGAARDTAGNLYIADGYFRVRQVGPTGGIVTMAGNGTSGYSGDNAAATAAQLNGWTSSDGRNWGIARDVYGNTYIADTNNHRVRKVGPTGVITTFAGNGTPGFSGDNGSATSAQLDFPGGVAVDATGNLYIADTYNSRVRKVATNGNITTVAGTGNFGYQGDNGPAISAKISYPAGVAVDPAGNLYIADTTNNAVRKVANGTITTVAGTGIEGYSGDNGPGTSAQLSGPYGIALDGAGYLYIADSGNSAVRRVDLSGTITTVAGTGDYGYSGDGGPALSAMLSYPIGLAADPAGNVYVADAETYSIRLLTLVNTQAVLTVQVSHIGTFTPAQNASYNVVVTNAASAGATSGTVSVTETLPASLQLSSMSGTGWSCAANACTRSDSLAAGASYPPITVTVLVAPNAPVQVTNQVSVSGGGAATTGASDTAILPCTYSVNPPPPIPSVPASAGTGSVSVITQGGCPWTASNGNVSWITITSSTSGTGPGTVDYSIAANTSSSSRTGTMTIALQPFPIVQLSPAVLTITKAHIGNFTQGQNGAAYTITVSNSAAASATSGTVTVTESVPTGLTLVSMSGTGWTCSGVSCSRSDSLAPGSSYPAITVTVNVAASAPSLVTNAVSVYGGGSPTAYASDPTSVVPPGTTSAAQFIPVTPCRIMDTRQGSGKTGAFGYPSIPGGTSRDIPVPQSTCNIPGTAVAYSLNVTVVPPGQLIYLSIWPTGSPQPVVSTLNSFDGRILANAAIVPAGSGGSISVFVSDTSDVIIDINGYFAAAGTPNGLALYPATPCRVADTRNAAGTFGGPYIGAGASRSFPIPSSSCGIPAAAQAYSLNITVVPRGPMGYLTTWPTGQAQPVVSTLNALDGLVVANAAIVPAGANGAISVFVSDATDVIVDINGYFAPPGSAGALSLYTLNPCRVVDTRAGQGKSGAFGPPTLNGGTSRDIPMIQSTCAIPSNAQAYSVNVTVVPPGPMIYLTMWPTLQPQPGVSTLNSFAGKVVANAAIVPAGSGGAISIFVSDPTNVILDINGYFAQ